MPRSKICLPDVNVWVALTSDIHQFHPHAAAWFAEVPAEGVGMCRVAQMGLLRLITNPAVMGGEPLSQTDAWTACEELLSDERVFFAHDDVDLTGEWRRFTSAPLTGRNLWTDAYLAAFAATRGWSLVTFDRAFKRVAELGTSVEVLGPTEN